MPRLHVTPLHRGGHPSAPAGQAGDAPGAVRPRLRAPRAAASRLLERDRELRELGTVLEDAVTGTAGTAIVEAAAGLGKTALLRCAREHAATLGFRTLEATPDEPERHIPFEAVRALLEGVVEIDGDDALLRGAAGLCRQVLTGLETPPEADGHALQQAFVLLLRRLAAQGPVLLLVDDAHWADAASLGVLEALVRRGAGRRPVLVLAARPDEAPSDGGALARLAADPETRLLRPKPLSADAVCALVRTTLGEHTQPALCQACHDVTAGNPFLLRQLLRELDDEAVDIRSLGRAELQRLGPRSISRSVLVRLARLTPDAVAICRAAAVLGEHGSLASVAALAQLPVERAAAAADALSRVTIFRRSRGFAFVHPIVRSAVLADLGPHERAALHADAVRILREGGAAAGALAAHLLEAEPAADEDAVHTLLDAAREALRRGVPADAVAYLRRALEEPPGEALRLAVLEELGRAELHRDPAAALEVLDQAVGSHPQGEERLQARRTQAEALIVLGRTRDAILLLDAVADHASAAGAGELAALCQAQIAAVARSERGTREVARRQGRSLRHGAGDGSLGRVLHLANAAIEEALQGCDAARVLELADAALSGGRLLREGDARLACELAVALDWVDRVDQSEEVLQEVLARSLDEADVRARITATALLAHLAYRRGDLQAAADQAHAALGAEPAAEWRAPLAHAVATLVDVLVEQDGVPEAERLLVEHGLQHALPGVRSSIDLYGSRARLRLHGGDPDAALRDAEEGLSLASAWGPCVPASGLVREWQARALEALGELDRARDVASGELRRAEMWGVATSCARAMRTRARFSPREEAVCLLERAVEVATGAPDVLELARDQLELGATLRRAGRRGAARPLLGQAREAAEACGATALVREAVTELGVLGVRRRRQEEADRGALTAGERRVAALAARGLSNREIADQLFVTHKTVEAHLTSTYRKLGIRSRTELVRQAATTDDDEA